MATSSRSRGCPLGLASWLAIAAAIALSGDCTLAQNIILDESLGPAETLAGPNYVIPQAVGQTVGSNLFHSFERFNLDTGESAGFQSTTNIRNIMLRVTGSSASVIDGRIYTESPSVNLFLINPSGIVFGPNATINVGGMTRGSFVATTINGLVWPNGGQFSATNPAGPDSLLTIVGDPSGFISSLRLPQPIQSSGSTLRVDEGQSLVLLGGDVNLNNSSLYVDNLVGGRISLAGVLGAGTVGLSVDGNDLRLSFPNSIARADVSITNESDIRVLAQNGGSISIKARNLNVLGGSNLLAGIGQSLGAVGSQAGDIEINMTGTVTVAGSSLFNSVQSQAVGNSGNINIAAQSLFVTDDAQLVASNYGQQGNAGNVNINVRDMVFLKGSAVFSTVEELGAVGKGGDINITAGSLSMTNNAQLVASTFGQGNVGNVNINVRDMAFLEGSAAFSAVGAGAIGKGGDINITTGSLWMTDGAYLSASTFGQGDAGSVNINARDGISFNGESSDGSNTAAVSTVGPEGIGNGGGINIKASSLSVTNGAILIGSTKPGGQGKAGSVNINVRDSVSFDGVGSDKFPSAALSAVELEGIGKGGDINITSGSLSVTNGAYLSASTFGQGDAGSVNINARHSISFNGAGSDGLPSAAFSTVEDTAVGNGGGINITTGSLSLTNGALLSASTRGQGNGGNITLNANTLEAVDGGQVLTTSRSNGKAGDITLNVNDSITLSGSDPTYFARLAQSREQVRVFDVFGRELAVREQVAADAGPASGLFASTFENSTGQGGDLRITTGQLVVQNEAEVNVSSEGSGNAGSLAVEANYIKLDSIGKLSGTTASGRGGDIQLDVRDLILMRNGSAIATTAANNGTGGNITINAPFIVAVNNENSDIIANADQGSGGRIEINATGIYGLEYRDRLTPKSDINASSNIEELDGVVELNTLNVDPSSGLINLPSVPVDTQVAQGCAAGGSQAQSKFIITGRGGLPANPKEILTPDAVQVDWVTRNPEIEQSSKTVISPNPTSSAPNQIVEATGWTFGPKGEVIFTAQALPVQHQNSWQPSAKCDEN